MLNQTQKGLYIYWSYRFNLWIWQLSIAVFFVGIGLLLGGGELKPEELAGTLLGFLVWYYAVIAIANMSFILMEEAQAGTLEQTYMSPTPTATIFVGRVLSTTIISTISVSTVGTAIALVLGIHIPLTWEAFPVFVLTMLGLFGLGYAIGGATIVFKRVFALSDLVIDALLFFNGSLLPVDKLPGVLEGITKFLPTTQGIIVLRKIILDGHSLASVWADGSLVFLLVHSAGLLAAGWLVFQYAERIAKRRGTLGQY
jgi:ABC-2 type transport system permease protein